MTHFRSMVGACFVLCAAGSATLARPIETWTYQKLWNDADLVCVAHVKASKLVANDDFEPDYLEKIESRLTVDVIMKGDRSLKEVTVVYYRYKKGVNGIGNGPSFAFGDDEMRFGEKSDQDEKRDRPFLLFLKPVAGGRFKPVSGDMDAGFSVSPVNGRAFLSD